MPFDPDKALAKLDSLAASQKPENVPPKKPRPFFGLPPKLEKAVFPRAVETREKGGGPLRTAIPGALDVISAPLRAATSLPALAPGGETFGQAFGRKEARPQKGIGKVGEFVGGTLRDPLTPIAALGTLGAAPVAKFAAKPILKSFARGSVEQVTPAIVRQAEISSRTGKVDIPKQIGEAAAETAFGGLGGTIGTIAASQATKAGKKLLSSALKTKDVTAKMAGKDVADGIEQIANDVARFRLETPTGNFGKMADKANARINIENRKLDKVINNFAEENPATVVDVDKIFLEFMDDIEKGKVIEFFGSEQAASDIADNVHKALEKRKLAGDQPVANLRKIKQTMVKGLRLFQKGKFGIAEDPIKRQVGELAQLRIAKSLNEFIPEAKQLNENMRSLITTRKALTEADKRTANHNFLSLRTAILTGAGIGGGSMETLMAGLAASGVLGSFAKGRGASQLLRIGGSGTLLPATGRIIGARGSLPER